MAGNDHGSSFSSLYTNPKNIISYGKTRLLF